MATMRAMVVEKPGTPFRLQERPIPQPERDEVRIRVQACGVCHSDSIVVDAGMPGLTYPRIPGHEVIGTIEAVGSQVPAEDWKPGTRVGVGWFCGSCGQCANCRRGNAFACQRIHGATGITRDGGYATHMLARMSALVRVPAELDSVASAPLLCAGVTTFNALRHCGAGPGDLVAVLGVGGLGHLAIQYAAKEGFRTVAINRGRDREQLARSLGAQEYIDNAESDPAAALQALGGAKAILATVTNAEAMQGIVGGLGPNGVMMVIGVVDNWNLNSTELIGKCAAIRGWYAGIAADSEDTLDFSNRNRVQPMNEVYPFSEAQAAYDRMMKGKVRFRAVLRLE